MGFSHPLGLLPASERTEHRAMRSNRVLSRLAIFLRRGATNIAERDDTKYWPVYIPLFVLAVVFVVQKYGVAELRWIGIGLVLRAAGRWWRCTRLRSVEED
jgi:hypothetical protein